MRAARMRVTLLLGLALSISLVAASSASAIDEFDKYAVESVSASLSTPQAGAHADLTIGFKLTQKNESAYAQTRDVEVKLPPGMIGNPTAFPACSVDELGNVPKDSKCSFDSQVGVTEVTVKEPIAGTFTEPIYNMTLPENGDVVARFGFYAGAYPALINVRVDPIDYSVVATLEGAPSAAGLREATSTLWGVPADESHDAERLTPQEAVVGGSPPGGHEAGLPAKPFLSNPTNCTLARQVAITARSYQLPDRPSTASASFPAIIGCDKLEFKPTFTAIPTNPEAAAPSGLDAELTIPQDESPNGRASSTLRSARVTLPEGMAINPAAGAGLDSCSADRVGYGRNVASDCPDAAKIGAVEVEVPALRETLKGAVYQRSPEPGHLLRFWVVTDEQGVHLKLPAEIEANRVTGQLATVFSGIDSLGGLPQVPFEKLRLLVFGGPRAPLSTPASCGTYQTAYSFTPWSGKPAAEGQTAMQISSGCAKGGFSPSLVAGTTHPLAGAFSPFVFTLIRSDGEANPKTVALHLPQGLLAKLAGVPLCPEAAAAKGSCPADSQIGSVAAAAGYGPSPLWIPQPGKAPTAAYLAGSYKGAPYSVVSVIPAQAGPFDLGLVVNRAAVAIDPETGLATIKTDPLPQILEGIPVTYRALHVEVDRPHFTLNPTGCQKKKITATVVSAGGAVADPSDSFQASDCGRLAYKPKLRLAFRGQTRRTGNPAIRAVLTQKSHQANTAAATVLLPAGQFIDNAHISTPCTRVQFGEGKCPRGSILGHASARTPLLDKPLRGPVYFRSNGGERELPDIVADLHGQIHITLVGYIDSVKTGSEASRVRTRFLHVPDAPVMKFTMSLFGGTKGLVENSTDLCRSPHRAQLELRAQNGRSISSRPLLLTHCGIGGRTRGGR